jgi:hypothetical protein
VALGAFAVLGVFAAVSGTVPGSTPPAKVVPAKPTPTLKVVPTDPGESAYLRDIDTRLPGLLQPLLPAGITAQAAPDDAKQPPGRTVMLTGPAGTNTLRLLVQTADVHLASGDSQACSELLPEIGAPGHVCTTVRVAGGRLFSGEIDDNVKNSLGAFPDDAFKPGMATAIYVRNYFYAFAPDQPGRGIVRMNLVAQTMDIPWAAKTPKDWPAGYPPFAPDFPRVVALGNDPEGALLTSGQFLGLLSEPGWGAVEALLDPGVAAG